MDHQANVYSWETYELDDRLYYLTFVTAKERFSYKEHTHSNHHEIVFVTQGCLGHTVNRRTFEQTEGSIVFVEEKDVHSLSSGPLQFYNLAFPTKFFRELAHVLFPFDEATRRKLETVEFWKSARLDRPSMIEMIELFERMLADYRPFVFLQAMAKLLESFTRIDDRVAQPGGLHFLGDRPLDREYYVLPSFPQWLVELYHFVVQSPRVPTMPELVERSGKSKEHLIRSFRKHLNSSVAQFLTELKLSRVAVELIEARRPIREVIARYEFKNSSYFFTLFKKRYGMSPQQYRVRHSAPGNGSSKRIDSMD